MTQWDVYGDRSWSLDEPEEDDMTFQDEELWICKACGGHHEGGPDGHLERFLQICESCLHDSPDPLAMVLKDILAQPPGDLSTAHGRELTAEVLYEIILSLSD